MPPKLTPKSEIILKDKKYISESEGYDLVISCGRKSVIPSILLKKRNNNFFTIHIQDPKVNFNNFDIIIAPEHDGISGDNVITSKGAIHYITKEEIEKSKNYLVNKVKNQKVVTLILGGPNKYYSFDNKEILKIFNQLKIRAHMENISRWNIECICVPKYEFLYLYCWYYYERRHNPLQKVKNAILIRSDILGKEAVLTKMSKEIDKRLTLKYGTNTRKE